MKQAKITLLTLFLVIFSACGTSRPPVPPGTVPLAIPPTQAEEQQGHKVLSELTNKYELDYNHPRFQEVQDVMKALTEAAGASAHPWHIFLLKDAKFKNAGATKGNHIFLWTAMLDYTRNKDELAGVLAHEVAHVLARHTDADSSETMRKTLVGIGAAVAGIAVSQVIGGAQLGANAARLAQQLASKVGEGLIVNPYSQGKELEADHIGLFLMAKAKFNPESAVLFWERASKDRSFDSVPSFFSTHPSSSKRLVDLRKYLADAKLYYNSGSQIKGGQSLGTQRKLDVQPHQSYPPPATLGTQSPNNSNSNDSWDIRN